MARLVVLFLSTLSLSLSASALDISFNGASGKRMYFHLLQRAQVNKWQTKNFFGNRVDSVGYQGFIECGVSHGRYFGNSYGCKIPGTSFADIVADNSNDGRASKKSPLKVSGVSAARMFTEISSLSDDPSYYTRTESKFMEVGIAEAYCQLTHGAGLADEYQCLMPNVALDDSNVQPQVTTK